MSENISSLFCWNWLLGLSYNGGYVAAFHTPGLRGRDIQDTWCVLGGKSRVNGVTLFLTPPFRLNS